ncbi:hypothetical protein PVAP13_2KG040216 [Panicum virgatum]|uniref:Uncharacterized protein n=1 Tax=Panicum virgatum TaxID=38727 RepID=A0A8T0VU79_PANVG|nr:hypothetical protein PVAP13_2KG040216 [Panicum virgatum]
MDAGRDQSSICGHSWTALERDVQVQKAHAAMAHTDWRLCVQPDLSQMRRTKTIHISIGTLTAKEGHVSSREDTGGC